MPINWPDSPIRPVATGPVGGTADVDAPKPSAPPTTPAPAPADDFSVAPKPPEVLNNPEFKKADPAAQKAATDAIGSLTDKDAKKNVADLVTSPGFSKLPAAAQTDAVKALMKAPNDSSYAADLKSLVNNGGPYKDLCAGSKGPAVKDMQTKLKAAGFDPGPLDGDFGPKTQTALKGYQKANGLKQDGVAGPETLGELNGKHFSALSATDQSAVLQQVSNFPKDPSARETISQMAQSPGFRTLPDADRSKLLNLVGGTNKDISGPARDAMNTLVNDPKFQKASAADQAKQLQAFATDEKFLPSVVAPQPHAFDASRNKYKLTGPVDEKNYAFPSGKADALKYEVEVNGQKVPVYMPKNPVAGKTYQTIDEVAKGIAALPESSRKVVNKVQVDANDNPDDAYWAKKFNDPTFHSYMTSGAAGVVSIYPGKQTQDYLDGTMIHETGHTLSKQKWGETDDPRWKGWDAAMAKDATHASQYAKNNHDEDFGETLQLYQQVKGTPQEAEVRALMPERFKIIDGLLAGKP